MFIIYLMKHIFFFICLILIIIYLNLYNSCNKKFGGEKVEGPPVNKPRGKGSENMPDGPEKEAALKREEEIKKDITGKQNIKIKKTYKQNALQRRLDQLITENGRAFLTFLWFQRKYFPNPLEPAWTSSIVWMPLGPNENFHKNLPNIWNPTDPMGLWIPNRKH